MAQEYMLVAQEYILVPQQYIIAGHFGVIVIWALSFQICFCFPVSGSTRGSLLAGFPKGSLRGAAAVAQHGSAHFSRDPAPWASRGPPLGGDGRPMGLARAAHGRPAGRTWAARGPPIGGLWAAHGPHPKREEQFNKCFLQ